MVHQLHVPIDRFLIKLCNHIRSVVDRAATCDSHLLYKGWINLHTSKFGKTSFSKSQERFARQFVYL